ncbi:MAG: aminotransferase class I/II-fold pyridoxal phosphate-dependent enzyme [Actinomycetes bacterium]
MALEDLSSTDYSPETKVVAAGRPARIPDGDLNTPISLSSTFHPGGPMGYGRYGNETWTALESAIESLEHGKTLIFSSGMAAINAVFSLLPIGSVVTASRNGYTGVMVVLDNLAKSGHLEVRFVDVANTEEVLAALPGTSLLWLESPTNPALEVADLPTLISAAKAMGCGVAVDNTFATPLLQQPLLLGADISVHSVTKYLAGHSDVLLGSVSTRDLALYKRIEDARKFGGSIAGPFEAWLALRGFRTLALRMERAQSNAMELATRLQSHSAVERVRYPGLPTDPHHQRARSFMAGFGAVLSIDVKGGARAADKACEASRLVTYATSLGGVESLWERRHRWSIESPSIPVNLVRLSVGIEEIEDLWRDIDQALLTSQLPD